MSCPISEMRMPDGRIIAPRDMKEAAALQDAGGFPNSCARCHGGFDEHPTEKCHEFCRCGSGSYPRHCPTHPENFEKHCRELSGDGETVTLPAWAWDALWAAMEASSVALGRTEIYAAHERIVDCWIDISYDELATRSGAACGHALKGSCESCR